MSPTQSKLVANGEKTILFPSGGDFELGSCDLAPGCGENKPKVVRFFPLEDGFRVVSLVSGTKIYRPTPLELAVHGNYQLHYHEEIQLNNGPRWKLLKCVNNSIWTESSPQNNSPPPPRNGFSHSGRDFSDVTHIVSRVYSERALHYLRKEFFQISILDIKDVLRRNNHHLFPSWKELKVKLAAKQVRELVSNRKPKDQENLELQNDPEFQAEMAFIEELKKEEEKLNPTPAPRKRSSLTKRPRTEESKPEIENPSKVRKSLESVPLQSPTPISPSNEAPPSNETPSRESLREKLSELFPSCEKDLLDDLLSETPYLSPASLDDLSWTLVGLGYVMNYSSAPECESEKTPVSSTEARNFEDTTVNMSLNYRINALVWLGNVFNNVKLDTISRIAKEKNGHLYPTWLDIKQKLETNVPITIARPRLEEKDIKEKDEEFDKELKFLEPLERERQEGLPPVAKPKKRAGRSSEPSSTVEASTETSEVKRSPKKPRRSSSSAPKNEPESKTNVSESTNANLKALKGISEQYNNSLEKIQSSHEKMVKELLATNAKQQSEMKEFMLKMLDSVVSRQRRD